MDIEDADALVKEAYAAALLRAPGEVELKHWTDYLLAGHTAAELLGTFRRTKEFKDRHEVKLQVPAGHFYSPIVNPKTVRPYYEREAARPVAEIPAIKIDVEGVMARLRGWRDIIADTHFDENPGGAQRYYTNNLSFPSGDAAILRATIAEAKPKRIIEIGSGNSTACMLDTLDEFKIRAAITCIEPYPETNLDRLLRPADRKRVTVLQQPVQDVPLDQFAALDSGDILFIDSTHVLKTGSDVHYELFQILPVLKRGVLIHLHDCGFPFEYPPSWIFDRNWSWNEVYALRAFLMYNKEFQIRFWMHMILRLQPDAVNDLLPEQLQNCVASGIWLERV